MNLTKLTNLKYFVVAVFLTFALPQWANAWDLAKDSKGIKVYTKKTNLSKFKAFKAETVLDGPVSKYVEIMNNPATYKTWMDGVIQAKSVKKLNANKEFTYMVQTVPVLKPRHAVLEVDKNISANEAMIKVELTDVSKKMIPAHKKYVPIKLMKGTYHFKQLANGKTKVVMEAVADPAGNIPSGIANLFIVKTPFNTLKNLKKK